MFSGTRTAVVYLIEDPSHPDDPNYGYVGVTREGREKTRFKEHVESNRVGKIIAENGLTFSKNMKILFKGTENECYEAEKKLRPYPLMGWNESVGGESVFRYDPGNSESRSAVQKRRMANAEIKEAQSIAFRRAYYSNVELIELRKQRAREHMSDPVKKTACLGAIHREVACEICGYRNNVGNVAKHMKKHHEAR